MSVILNQLKVSSDIKSLGPIYSYSVSEAMRVISDNDPGIVFYNSSNTTLLGAIYGGNGIGLNIGGGVFSVGNLSGIRMIVQSTGEVGVGNPGEYNLSKPGINFSVRGSIIRTNSRLNDYVSYPLSHSTSSEAVFEIDPTWTDAELREFFGDANVSWAAVADAPGGYCIYLNGAVDVGGPYGSGFPFIPVDTNDIFYMECWIQNVGTGQTHYMGSAEYDHNFTSLGGNPGTYGYWVMSNTNPTTTWTKVSGYIGGFGTSTGQFKAGTKYWTPLGLFNYTAGTGTRACRISGWKVYKVYQAGNRSLSGRVTLTNGGLGGNGTLTVSGDITTYRSSNSGVIYFGSDQSHYLFFDGSNYYLPSGNLYVVNNTNLVLHSGNYNSYAPTLTGTGASGTWGISITGNAATATTLQTARNIAGVSFNGSADISITGQNISTNITTATNDLQVAKYLRWKNYGDNHVLFDASQGTSPAGTTIDRVTPANPINSTSGSNTWGYNISLMGWNGNSTYGVRVDRAREIDNQIQIIESLRANRIISGGGNITTTGSQIKWDARFIVISCGRGSNFAVSGFWNIDFPAVGTVITGVGGTPNQTVTSNGIAMNGGSGWNALYYILPIGATYTSVAANFRLVGYDTDIDIPHNWVLICVVNADAEGYVFYFSNGVTHYGADVSYMGIQTSSNVYGTIVKRDSNGNINVNGISAISLSASDIPNVRRVRNAVYNNLGNPTVEEQAIIHGEFNNKFRFWAPQLQEQSTDGTTWTTSTRASAQQLADMMIGEGQNTSISAIPAPGTGNAGYYRLTWDYDAAGSPGYCFLDSFYCYNSTNGNNVTFTIQGQDSGTSNWTTVATGTISNWPGHTYIPHSTLPFVSNATNGYYKKVRITFAITSAAAYGTGFQIYGIEWWGGYPAGKRNVQTYDSNKNVYWPAKVYGTQFVDNNDSNYYVDPDGVSMVKNLNVGAYFGTSTFTNNGQIQLGTTAYNYLFTQGTWGSSITAGILAHCADNWEFAIHDSNHRVASPFAFFGGATNVLKIGRDIGWGVTPVEIAGNLTISANLIGSANSANLVANTASTYGAWNISGSRNSYGGIYDSYSGVATMFDSSGNGGFYRESPSGRWYLYHNYANNCLAISGYSTTAGYVIQINGDALATGNIAIQNANSLKLYTAGTSFSKIYSVANTGLIIENGYDVDPEGGYGIVMRVGAANTDVFYAFTDGSVAFPVNVYFAGNITCSGQIGDANGSFRKMPKNSRSGAYTLVASDTGLLVANTSGGITVPNSVFTPGDFVTIYNESSSSQTITQGSGVTLRQAGTSNTGNRTLAGYGVATLICISTSEFVIRGDGLT